MCGNETKRLQDIIERSTTNFNDLFLNNGGNNKCFVNTIETSFYVWSHDSCAIRWRAVNLKGKQKINAYIIQYVPIKSTKSLNDKVFLERDSCSSHGWQHAFVKLIDWHSTADGHLEFNLTGLNQFTIYAFSIQTYLYDANETSFQIGKESNEYEGAISQVKTFRTLLKAPSRVKNIETLTKTANSITLQWSIEENEESAIEFFYIDVVKKPFNVTLIDRRNYCTNPIVKTEREASQFISLKTFQQFIPNDDLCCYRCCRFNEEQAKYQEREDFDFQVILVKFGEREPRRILEPRIEIKKFPFYINRFIVSSESRTYTIDNLDPFSLHTFYVHSCASDAKCSDYELHSEMTQMYGNESFNRVELEAANYALESTNFYVYFEEPKQKNGVVVSFFIELREIIQNSSVHAFSECITRRQHQINGFKWDFIWFQVIFK